MIAFQIGASSSRREIYCDAVGDVDGQADDMLGAGAVLGKHGDDVLERLAELFVQRCETIISLSSQPIMPAVKIIRPVAEMPFE